MKYIPPADTSVENYISTVLLSENSEGSTYIPFQYLPKNYREVGSVHEKLQNLCDNGEGFGGTTAFNYLLGELIDNVYQHSCFSNAAVMAQKYPHKKFLEISIFDDGISIPGSFEKYGIEFENDAGAISKAINGTSTKDESRGRGLNSSTSMYIEGGGAEVLIISGNGIFYKKKDNPAKLYNMEDTYRLQGTLISVRSRYPVSKIDAHIYY